MYYKIPSVGTLTDDEYTLAVDVDDLVIWPLMRAGQEVDEALYFVIDEEVDNEAQREYIKGQVQNLMRQLKEIEDKLEG